MRFWLFGKNSKKKKTKHNPKICLDLFNNDSKIQEESIKETELPKSKNIKEEIKKNINRGDEMAKYLVVLDTANRPEVKDRGLQGGLKNFYFVNAATETQAKEFVMSTFAHNPTALSQLQYSFTVTDLKKIVNNVNQQMPIWSYIPIQRGVRAPGQQSVPPSIRTNPNDRDEVIPMTKPPVITTPQSQDDTPKELDPEAQAPVSDPNNPMVAMMGMFAQFAQAMNDPTKMQQMMSSMGQQTAPQQPKMPTVERGNLKDPETAKRLNETAQASSKVKHGTRTVGDAEIVADDDPLFTEAEAKHQKEIEQYKNKSTSNASNPIVSHTGEGASVNINPEGLGDIDLSDNKDIDAHTFKTLLKGGDEA